MTFASTFSGIGGEMVAAKMMGWDVKFHCEINPFCRRVLEYWFPESISYEDITKTDFSEWRGKIDVLTGGFPCFLKGTKVLTSEGYKNIEEICLGDEVLTKEGDFRKVNATMKSRKRSIVKIKTQGISEPITTTANHPFWVCDELGRYGWKEAGELLKGERVAFRCIDGKSEAFTPAFWRMIGRFVGDGWVLDGKRKSNIPQGHRGSRVNSREHKVVICSSKAEADEVLQIIKEAGYEPTFVEERTVCKFIISNKWLQDFCFQFGRYALHKKIAPIVFSLERERKKAFFEGYLSADGYTDKNGAMKITTVSEELALGTAQIARDIYHRPVSISRKTVNRECIIEGRKVKEHPQFCVTVSPSTRQGYYKDGMVWCLIKNIEHRYERKTVFNIGVEDSETYTVSGIVVHNCQPFSYAGRRGGAEDDRYLWPYMFGCIDKVQPTWVIAENVAGVTTMVEQGDAVKVADEVPMFEEDNHFSRYEYRQTFTIERICSDLEQRGYSVQPVLIPACAVGAPHRRDRVFIIAHRESPVSEDAMRGGQLYGQHEVEGSKRDERHSGSGSGEWLCGETSGATAHSGSGGQSSPELESEREGAAVQQQRGEQSLNGIGGQSNARSASDASDPGAEGLRREREDSVCGSAPDPDSMGRRGGAVPEK